MNITQKNIEEKNGKCHLSHNVLLSVAHFSFKGKMIYRKIEKHIGKKWGNNNIKKKV